MRAMVRRGLGAVLAMVVAAPALGAVRTQEVAFEGAGGLVLRGTLVFPDETTVDDPAPGLLLLPGSGPTDRDGNQGPLRTDLLKQIAVALGEAGVATLRFDKRAVLTYQADWPTEQERVPEFFSYQNFVDDAKAAYAELRGHTAIDEHRTGLLGHSAGGLLTLQIASDKAGWPDQPAAFALIATSGRTLDVVLEEQIRAQLARAPMDDGTKATWIESLQGAIAAVNAGEAPSLEGMPVPLRGLFNPSAMGVLPAYFSRDPAELAASTGGSALVLQGDGDAQISAERDFPVLVKALEGRERFESESVLIEGASHNLKPMKGPMDPGFIGPVAEEAMAAIVAWATRVLGV